MTPYLRPQIFLFATIPWMLWSYPENLEMFVAAISELLPDKHTDKHTNRQSALYI